MITLATLWLGGALSLCCRDLAEEQLSHWSTEPVELWAHMFFNLIWPISIVLGLVLED
ncbi:MAG: hypothetical protein K2X73_04750 [Sphingomonas sp.]|uniref:hypothetical protein n=1 Tax=Sphingomonas sp. TaxID=28214 RepID=UPI0025F1E979|nr:hypothetical protein [Sphingomonas sp.]MBX9881263.1 hypothetical protein [Sphingomonas sp.]